MVSLICRVIVFTAGAYVGQVAYEAAKDALSSDKKEG